MFDVIWDMETNDPDDFLTLLFLAGHPKVNLKAVTLLPGTPEQVGLVKFALREWFRLDTPIGSHNLNYQKPSVSSWYYDAYGKMPTSNDAAPASEILKTNLDINTTLIMGAPLTNLAKALSSTNDDTPLEVNRLFIQCGFAGDGVVPATLQMEKFRGMTSAPTHNLMHDRKAADAILNYPFTGRRFLVSKNVCHRVMYEQNLHQYILPFTKQSLSLQLIWQGMDVYLKQNPAGKMLHDPLAACCAIDEAIGTWVQVAPYREGNAWGSQRSNSSGTWIIIDYSWERFIQTFTQY
jgi:inosine-uridine nucleoside N-ribohydrolase